MKNANHRTQASASNASRARASGSLVRVNEVVAAALGSWKLPARVQRLALPSLLYDEVDLEQMSVVVLEEPRGAVAVAAWEAAAGADAIAGSRAALLHGLYVVPGSQGQGLGTALSVLASHWALTRGFDVITARVWRESEEFFRRLGFAPLTRCGAADSFPRRMRKALR